MTLPSGRTSTGTVPLGEAASIAGGFADNFTSRNAQAMPLIASASLAAKAAVQGRDASFC